MSTGRAKLPVQEIRRRLSRSSLPYLLALVSFSVAISIVWDSGYLLRSFHARPFPPHAAFVLSRCKSLHEKPGPSSGFWSRTVSDRFEPGTPPTLIQNATIWTGGDNGYEILQGDVFLDGGIIKAVGRVAPEPLNCAGSKLVTKNVGGAWVSPAINDLHSHIGVGSIPRFHSSDDAESFKAPAMPFLRSLDGFNTHDAGFELSRAGGVASALILPGSADNIGGQAFVAKIRKTKQGSPSSMVLEPPEELHVGGTLDKENNGVRWRHMKHACGENPSMVHNQIRMDSIWEFRKAYSSAKHILKSQDDFCARAQVGKVNWFEEDFPEDLAFEALVDVLRGRTKVNVHCYEAVDFDGIIRLSREFEFPIAAFHHAHEAYLVPDLIKNTWGEVPPALALFATSARYKREAYRGSEFAPKILNEHGLKVIMKSDYPIFNSRYLLYEAVQAHYYGLPAGPALASVTTTPAEVAGLGHRLGRVKIGYDADIVVWDSHPLTLGATPQQVYIDGIAQLSDPVVISKPSVFQRVPVVPDWDDAPKRAVEYEGLPPLLSKTTSKETNQIVIFKRVAELWSHKSGQLTPKTIGEGEVIVVRRGQIDCIGTTKCEPWYSMSNESARILDLAYGALVPGFISYGAPLGVEEIPSEASTNDGQAPDPLSGGRVPEIAGGDELVISAVDGLSFAGRDVLLAHRAGVTTAVTAPVSGGMLAGSSVAFRTGAAHRFEAGAIVKSHAAFHVSIGHDTSVSIATQIATLRRLLKNDTHTIFNGQVPLVITVNKADYMATLLQLKSEIENVTGRTLRMTFAGAAEAHIIADQIGAAGVGVIVNPTRPFPDTWDKNRILPGPPLSRDSLISTLVKANVAVGVGVQWSSHARNARFDIAWAALESNGAIGKRDALAFGTTNLQKLLGLEGSDALGDLVAYHGGSWSDTASKPVAVISSARAMVDMF